MLMLMSMLLMVQVILLYVSLLLLLIYFLNLRDQAAAVKAVQLLDVDHFYLLVMIVNLNSTWNDYRHYLMMMIVKAIGKRDEDQTMAMSVIGYLKYLMLMMQVNDLMNLFH